MTANQSTFALRTLLAAASIACCTTLGCATRAVEDSQHDDSAMTANEAAKRYGDVNELVREVPATDGSLGVVTYKAYAVSDTERKFTGTVILGVDEAGQVKYGLEANVLNGNFTLLRFGDDAVEATAPLTESDETAAPATGTFDEATLASLRAELKHIAEVVDPEGGSGITPQFLGLSDGCSLQLVQIGATVLLGGLILGGITATGGLAAVALPVVLSEFGVGAFMGGVVGTVSSSVLAPAFGSGSCITNAPR